MGLMKELNDLNNIYQKMYDEEYTVTAAPCDDTVYGRVYGTVYSVHPAYADSQTIG